ncbi:MAG: hypothetical protein ACRD21_09135 [Vicinamibacteria bacterium]
MDGRGHGQDPEGGADRCECIPGEFGSSSIVRADLDGTDRETLLSEGLGTPRGIALDVEEAPLERASHSRIPGWASMPSSGSRPRFRRWEQ